MRVITNWPDGLSEDSFIVDSLISFANDLNGQSRPGVGFQATEVGCQVFSRASRRGREIVMEVLVILVHPWHLG
jgi:hypothetical protein